MRFSLPIKPSTVVLGSSLLLLTTTGFNCFGGSATTSNYSSAVTAVTLLPSTYTDGNTSSSGNGCSTYYQTPPLTWQVKYSNGSTVNGQIPWPGGNTNLVNSTASGPYTVTYYTAPDFASNYQNDIANALSSWNTALAADVHPGGRFTLTLGSASSESSANFSVDIASESSAPIEANGGSEAFATIQLNPPQLQQGYIAIPNTVSDATAYAVALHEIGHSLGLDHNPQSSSAMYPWAEVQCYSNGTLPNAEDAVFLENTYDPRWAPTPRPVPSKPQCTPKSCPQTQPGTVLLNALATRLKEQPQIDYSVVTLQPKIQTNSYTSFLTRAVRTSRTALVNLSEDDGQRSTSASELYLGSNLVAEVSVGQMQQAIKEGEFIVELFPCKILSVTKSNATIRSGQTVYVADKIFKDGRPIANDPPVFTGEHLVAFLTPGVQASRKFGVPTYVFSLAMVSKYDIDQFGAMHSPAGAALPASIQLEGIGASSLKKYYSVSSNPQVDSISAALLEVGKRDHRESLSLAQYYWLSSSNPLAVWRRFIGTHSLAGAP